MQFDKSPGILPAALIHFSHNAPSIARVQLEVTCLGSLSYWTSSLGPERYSAAYWNSLLHLKALLYARALMRDACLQAAEKC